MAALKEWVVVWSNAAAQLESAEGLVQQVTSCLQRSGEVVVERLTWTELKTLTKTSRLEESAAAGLMQASKQRVAVGAERRQLRVVLGADLIRLTSEIAPRSLRLRCLRLWWWASGTPLPT